MKKAIIIISSMLLAIAADAQTLNVVTDNVTYMFPAAQAGEMTYEEGTTLTIMNKTFTLTDITKMYVDDSSVADNTVDVAYSGTTAKVTIAGNVAQYLTTQVNGAHVHIDQSDNLAQEITYTLSGSTTDGEFYMAGTYKASIVLSGLTLTNVTPVSSGAAIHIQNGKRINIKVAEGTTNTLTDAADGSQKGCLYVKGHAEFKQKGTLNVYGNVKHAIKAGEYISVKNSAINVKSAAGDGINCAQFFLMESGTVNISGVADDGIQCDLEGTTNTGETTDHEDEDSGNIYIKGGTLTMNITATAAKGMKSEGDMAISGGNIEITTTGAGTWDSDDAETKAAACMSADGSIDISGGILTLTSTGSGGKGIKCDNMLTISDGTVTVSTSGGLYYNNGTTENTNFTGDTERISSSYYSSPKGIKAGTKTESSNGYAYSGGLVITGGTVNVTTTGNNGEGIESKNTMTISGGNVTVNSHDDGLNSARDMYLKGGTVTVVAKNNDAIDANADMHISGGTVIACGASGAECGLDAAEGCHLYITGGNVLALAANNNSVSQTSGSQCVLGTTGSVSANSTVSVKSGSTTLVSFTIPSGYTSSGSTGGGFGPGGHGGSSRNSVLISCAGLTSGSSYTVTIGNSSTTVRASTTYSGM